MTENKKFNPKKLGMLNDPSRLEAVSPSYILDKLDMDSIHVIADVGAGTGLFSKAFLEVCPAEKAYALDISPHMIEWMKENLTVERGEITPLLMGESTIPLEDDSVDLLLMFNLYHELDEPNRLLKEVYRVLKEEGKVCIVDWKKEKTEHGPPLEHRVAEEKIMKDLKDSGFHNVKIDDGLKEHCLVWAAN